ncbi:MAG: Alpha/Beta hydrolase protein [Monoraphidium minutum]|nr:MAG: Alpha/Beta hydrolase protein [Monoraphidium minutum]
MVRYFLDTDEAVLECIAAPATGAPAGASASGTAAIVLHPWGRLGGCMHDPTVVAQYSACLRSGLFDRALRYNMRCAGRSRGKARSSSDPDVDDLVALCRHVLSEPLQAAASGGGGQAGGAPALAPARRVVLIGYSYGSCVAARALARVPEAVAYVSIGFPLGVLSRLFLGAGDAWAALAGAAAPKLLLIGDADNFTSLAQLEAAAARHAAAAPAAGPLDVEIIEGADHFFAELWDGVAARAQEWLAPRLSAPEAGGGAAAAAAGRVDG